MTFYLGISNERQVRNYVQEVLYLFLKPSIIMMKTDELKFSFEDPHKGLDNGTPWASKQIFGPKSPTDASGTKKGSTVPQDRETDGMEGISSKMFMLNNLRNDDYHCLSSSSRGDHKCRELPSTRPCNYTS
ncbi:hypothetical protein MPTK1_6g03880 [Marchantia polymorpha subsp. ruderalis]|uniref:Uncharacterized protein n=2 Tax=Marchantia polymorpha TaxID=3197 RepID=A0AAF6BNA3_MARPO|nr:hypothetical protein MARPO_0034s0130 [Marchantia polymorpha]BBN13487.1 hypothetical protein Mp_6g03880 [Marchantia polymorpha subsp. ruderalis]|eukprot:PTQ41553.1 hypothetical protein MARPO_0034s0130 [Marchantia polymorpha]